MSKRYLVEKILQVVITEEDLVDEEEELTADLALEIANDIDIGDWEEVDLDVIDTSR